MLTDLLLHLTLTRSVNVISFCLSFPAGVNRRSPVGRRHTCAIFFSTATQDSGT